MKKIFPTRLLPGGTVGIVAPSSAPHDRSAIERAIADFQSLGFKTVIGRAATKRTGFLAGSDSERALDINRMFSDTRIDAIVCLRGGHGATRILSRIDYAAIRKNPKIFVGFSDITALHCAIHKLTGLVTFHGPMITSNFGGERSCSFTRDSFLRAVSTKDGGALCSFSRQRNAVRVLRSGNASGTLIGGTLAILCNLLGTPYFPDLKKAILFLEDVGEPHYRIDRYLTQLLNSGVLAKVSGIVLGIWEDCGLVKGQKDSLRSQRALDAIFLERLGGLRIPMLSGLPFGHGIENATLPFGGTAAIHYRKRDLILSRAVR